MANNLSFEMYGGFEDHPRMRKAEPVAEAPAELDAKAKREAEWNALLATGSRLD